MTEIQILETLQAIAKEKGYELSEYAEKIAKRKETLPEWFICPCETAGQPTERHCISVKCAKEIEENGECHCRLFKKGEKK